MVERPPPWTIPRTRPMTTRLANMFSVHRLSQEPQAPRRDDVERSARDTAASGTLSHRCGPMALRPWLRSHVLAPLIMPTTLCTGCIDIHAVTPSSEGEDMDVGTSGTGSAPNCAEIGMPLNYTGISYSATPLPCSPTICEMNPDGSVSFFFCLQCPDDTSALPSPWATCAIGMGHDMARFDFDGGGAGTLALTLTVEDDRGGTSLPGELRFWYGEHPWRKYFELHERGFDGRPVVNTGTRTTYAFSPNACYSDDGLLPEVCRGACGAIDEPQNEVGLCEADFSRSILSLSAERCHPGARYEGTVTVHDLRYHPPTCTCIDDGDCPPDRPVCGFAEIPDLRCIGPEDDGSNLHACGGLCGADDQHGGGNGNGTMGSAGGRTSGGNTNDAGDTTTGGSNGGATGGSNGGATGGSNGGATGGSNGRPFAGNLVCHLV